MIPGVDYGTCLTVCYLILGYIVCVKYIHVCWFFAFLSCNPWISHFVIEFVSIFAVFTQHFPAITRQSNCVGGFVTAPSLGFMKFEFLLSFFFYHSLLLLQTENTSEV